MSNCDYDSVNRFIRLENYYYNVNKKDGYHQLNVRQFLHILASPGYAPGTIAVNLTRMERGFNAGQTHCSILIYLQPFTRAIAR